MTLRMFARCARLRTMLVLIGTMTLLFTMAGLAPGAAAAASAARPPQLWLPTPVGETWQILQGFYCGSHVGRQSRSLDFVNLSGPTSGAPARAAADGTTFVWEGRTGTLILSHGNGYYTLYSHLRTVITTRPGLAVRQGDQIGTVGAVNTDIPHLHFNFFYAPDSGAYNRTLLELDFADGYSFRDTSGCNQHRGATVVARAAVDTTPPGVSFTSSAQPGQWHCADQRIEFQVADDRRVQGFSQAFNRDPGGVQPDFLSTIGYFQLAWAGEGMHTFYVRAWDASGQQTLATFGPIGYDATAPGFALPPNPPTATYAAHSPFTVVWTPASDGAGSGVAGYHLYLGSDPNGVSDWFSPEAQVRIDGLAPGSYLLRAQAFDRACGKSAWVTVQQIIVQ